MAQWLKAFAVLVQNLLSVPSTAHTRRLITAYNPGYHTLFWSLWASATVHIHLRQTSIYIE